MFLFKLWTQLKIFKKSYGQKIQQILKNPFANDSAYDPLPSNEKLNNLVKKSMPC